MEENKSVEHGTEHNQQPEETFPEPIHSTPIIKPSDDMEVHSHTHTPRKKWRHYFYEFLMLFLAVFCGFLAEYQLEHIIENQREKQFIKSLIIDINSDLKLIDEQNRIHQMRIRIADSLIDFLASPEAIINQGDDLYYFGRIVNRTLIFANNDRTIEQMKNSGGFRLIRNQNASNEIMDYYQQIQKIRLFESRESGEQDEYKKLAVKIFDPRVFRKMTADTVINRITGNPSLLSNDKALLQELAGVIQYLTGSRVQIMSLKEKLKLSGLKLINFLNKEYHLK